MNRKNSPASRPRQTLFIEPLEPRIAPAALLESKFTSVAVGGSLLLDASGAPGTFQGLTTGSGGGSGSYLLYVVTGRALVFTTDINGNGKLDPGEITGIALGKDSLGRDPSIILFSDVNGDIITDLAGTSGSNLTDSDHNPNNGRDGQLLTDTNIANITIRTLTASDIDTTIAGNTVAARLALTSFSIHGDIIAGGNIESISIDTSGASQLAAKFNGVVGDQLYTGSTPSITGIYTGTAANGLDFHFTQNNPFTPQVEGTIQGFSESAGEHGGNISNIAAADPGTTFSIGTIATGAGGTNAPGGNITDVTMHGATGGYQVIAGDGGAGGTGGTGGSIVDFNDLGSITGQVILHTGSGGQGLLGAGGAAGTISLVNPKIAAQVEIFMGSGGEGFTTGGSGASFTSADFDTPETTLPIGGKFYGTWHNIGDVGNTHPLAGTGNTYAPEVIDFNGDGFGDAVYTNSSPDQVTVVFGDGTGGILDNGNDFNAGATATVNLKVPGITDPVVAIGDFNGDGRPDIAVASGDPHNFGGVYIFLDQIGTTLDPISSSNYTHSLVGDHPFSTAHESALPTLADQGFYQTSGAVVALVAGDFNGDGVTDLAYVQNVTAEFTFTPFQTVGVLLGDSHVSATTGKPVGTGYFYGSTNAPRAAASVLNTIILPAKQISLQATSLTNTNLPDATTGLPAAPEVFIFSSQGADHFAMYSLAADPTTHIASAGLLETDFALGKVDTNRNLGPNNIALTQAFVQGLSIQDLDGDGNADVVVLTKTPSNFLITFQGDGAGNLTIQSGGGDNAGIFLGTGEVGIAIAATDTNTDSHMGTFDTVGVLEEPTIPNPLITEVLLRTADGTPSFYYNNGAPTFGRTFDLGIPIQDQTVETLDGFYAIAPTLSTGVNLHPATGYGALAPESSTYIYADFFLFAAPDAPLAGGGDLLATTVHYLTENGYLVFAGNGGGAVTGAAGAGGIVGAATTSLGAGTGAITFVLPADPSYEGNLFIQGGNGGNGFGSGGVGGDVLGVAVRYSPAALTLNTPTEIHAGNGGNGIGGDGGRGGNISEASIEFGTEFTAGNAGSGLHGGQGGSITGNGQGVYDTNTTDANLLSGIGGEGALQGGDGGAISGWDSIINIISPGVASLTYATGSGGGAAGGNGGNGGSIVNSSPDQNENDLNGPLSLTTGAGGSGLSGGSGGAINNFIDTATSQSAVPTSLTIITGNGGVGVSGAGGTGGTITNFSSNATGITSFAGEDLTGIGRVIAGDGGASFGAAGGNGGSLMTIVATATSTPMVVAAGAGGAGLTVGGDGGTVMNATVDSAALQIGKLLVVAGRGGDATAAQPKDITLTGDPDTTDLAHTLLAFGGSQGMAGNGGNITNLTQPVGAQTAVDLIAGNGGNTPNASTSVTTSTGVGHGGSISGVTLTGTVGAISRDLTQGVISNPAIQAYAATDEFGTTTEMSISAIVDLLTNVNPFDPNGVYGAIADNASAAATLTISGNVGIIAGASGTVRNAQPARDGVNGDVTSIVAQSYLSIVAGSVEAVAPVRNLSGLTITNSDGVLGADRSPTEPYTPNGKLDYFTSPTSTTSVTTLQAGYSLVGGLAADGTGTSTLSGDGAIFASNIVSTAGLTISGPRVFPAQTT